MPDTQNTVKNKRTPRPERWKPRSDKQGQTFFPNKKISSSRLRKTTAHKVQKMSKMHLQIFSQKTQKKVCLFRKKAYLCTGFEKKPEKYRGVEQLVARWAHNPKVVCSSQASATI